MATRRDGQGFVRLMAVSAALCTVLAAAGTLESGCSSSSTSSSPGGDGGRTADSATPRTDGTRPRTDGAASDGAKGKDSTSTDSATRLDSTSTDSATDARDSGTADGSDAFVLGDAAGILMTIPLTEQPGALAIDTTNNQLYVGLVDPNTGNNSGIAVINTTTNSVTTTLPAPFAHSEAGADAGTAGPFQSSNLMATDPTANLLYAMPSFGTSSSTVYVYDGALHALKTSFAVGAGLPQPCTLISWLVLDSAASRLYVACGTQVAVFNTTNDSLVTAIVLTDIQGTYGGGGALDTTNHLLFVSNGGPSFGQTTPSLLVDAIDTTTNMETGTQQNLGGTRGNPIGLVGGPGFATAVTAIRDIPDGGIDGGVYGTFYSLEPGGSTLPSGYVPQSYDYLLSADGEYLVIAIDKKTGYIGNFKITVSPTEGVPPAVSAPVPFDTSAAVPSGSTLSVAAMAVSVTNVYLTGYLYSPAGSSPIKGVCVGQQ